MSNSVGPSGGIQRAVANTVVGQMLPPGVVKGGTALKLRVGEAGSRLTPDFDAARANSVTLDDYLNDLGDKLAEGWAGQLSADARAKRARAEDLCAQARDLCAQARELRRRSERTRLRQQRRRPAELLRGPVGPRSDGVGVHFHAWVAARGLHAPALTHRPASRRGR